MGHVREPECGRGKAWDGVGQGRGAGGAFPRQRSWNLPANGLALDAPMVVVLGALSGLAWGKGNHMQPGPFQLQSESLQGLDAFRETKGH